MIYSSRFGSSVFAAAFICLVFFTANVQGVLVQTPCCSAYPHAGANFGPQLPWVSPGVAAVLSRSLDRECNGASVNTVVLIDRGMESFVDAVKACQEKGAVGVIVRNVASSGGSENDLVVMGAATKDHGVRVPSVFVSRKTGDELDAMLALNPSVFVELFAADDVNSIMAYLAYLAMSVEMLFFSAIFFAVVVGASLRRRAHSPRGRRCCRPAQAPQRTALIVVHDSDLLQPLTSATASEEEDPESKRPKEQAFPIVYANNAQTVANGGNGSTPGNARREELVNVPVDPKNEEPMFDQQEQ